MDQLPHLDGLSEPDKDALIQVLCAEIQSLKARIAELEAKLQAPKKDAHNSRQLNQEEPPSPGRKGQVMHPMQARADLITTDCRLSTSPTNSLYACWRCSSMSNI